MRPDLAKFRHFVTILKIFGNFWRMVYVVGVWQTFSPTLATDQNDLNDQILNQKSSHLVTLIPNIR